MRGVNTLSESQWTRVRHTREIAYLIKEIAGKRLDAVEIRDDGSLEARRISSLIHSYAVEALAELDNAKNGPVATVNEAITLAEGYCISALSTAIERLTVYREQVKRSV